MKIGIIGGTGDIGEGLAHRLSHEHEIIIGSRNKERACTMGECLTEDLRGKGIEAKCIGATNQEAVDDADIVILSVNYKHLESTLAGLTGFEDKIVITPVNPISKKDYFFFDPPAEGSAALKIKSLLPESSCIVAAFNNISAQKWKRISEELNYSVVVCSDDEDAKKTVMDLVNSISELKALDGGPLEMSGIVESMTPLILNIAKYNNMRDVGIKFF
ncbi:NADPH-dependent F420 reductase [Methanoplanus endosymbiosus]|uniref:NADPH-dependent F420 reductase n=1 Tax=Methanoplanus endosymbiosus TaxID=33865 RepID=A0A9E7PM35_9EURY|nr:NADPH-dependent F420 reductase [Methanoplanus endosymbiosus]UUX92380.1 NADPH-dependent F420 reductase [Methanoplanus endosymbiosus]